MPKALPDWRWQLWQWVHNGAKLDGGRTVTAEMYKEFRDGELEKLGGINARHYRDVVAILDQLVLSGSFTEFLTWPAYQQLIEQT